MAGQRIEIQYYGKTVAEIIPYEDKPKSLTDRIQEMQKDGSLVTATSNALPPLAADLPRALDSFLETRDD